MKRLLFGVLLSARAVAAPIGATAVIDRPLVTLDGHIIWKSEADERMNRPGQPAELKAVLDELIEEKLFLLRATEMRLDVEDTEIDAAITEIKQQNALDDKQFDEALAQQGFTRAKYRKDLRRQILVLRAANLELGPSIQITDAAIAKAATDRKLKMPLSEAERESIRKELHHAALVKGRADWVTERKKAMKIVIRSDDRGGDR